MDITMQKSEQKNPVSNSVLGIIMVIIVELMFFGGLISAYVLAEAGQIDWPPANQPRLPFWLTFGNMIILLLSGYLMYQFIKSFKSSTPQNKFLVFSFITGIVFFLIQGYEWMRILIFGMQTGRGLFASFFYTIIGLHGFHVIIGLSLLLFAYNFIRKNKDFHQKKNMAVTVGLFWFFVVLLWPVLYYLIYWV